MPRLSAQRLRAILYPIDHGVNAMCVSHVMRTAAALGLAVIGLTGCQPSADDVARDTQRLMQAKLDSDPELQAYHLRVSKVIVVHEESTRYRGIATLVMDGEDHEVGLRILADGNKVVYESDPGALLFVTQRAVNDAMKEVYGQPAAGQARDVAQASPR